uniref:Uncharacterized protein n=1 Tax=Onchocerca volvulus TaxID=6282 RepID=A0A8R1XUQ9_ONCVO
MLQLGVNVDYPHAPRKTHHHHALTKAIAIPNSMDVYIGDQHSSEKILTVVRFGCVAIFLSDSDKIVRPFQFKRLQFPI